MDNYVPPLKLWLYVFVIVFVGLAGFWGYAQFKYPKPYMVSSAFSESLKNAIAKNDADNPNAKSLVIYGSSLARCALPFISQIRAKIAANGHKVSIIRISISSINMKEAEYSHFFDYITEFPPDYLFFESNNLNVNSDDELPVPAADLLVDDLCRNVRKFLGLELPDFDEPPPVTGHFYQDKFNMQQFIATESIKRSVRAFSDNKVANDAFARLSKLKTKVIFLNFPLSPKSHPAYLNNDGKNKFEVLLASYAQHYGIECWSYPGPLDNSNFYDGGHLNYKGAKKYTEWFIETFNKLK